MKIILRNILIALIGLLLFSCNNDKKLAQKTVVDFFTAIKNENEEEMINIYPDFINIDTYYKSDTISIKDIKLKNGLIEVIIENNYKNSFGRSFSQNIELYLKYDDSINKENLKIYDSKGIRNYNEDDKYLFAIKTGCINKKTDITDQSISKKLKIADELLMNYSIDLLLKLKKEVKIITWSWESGYGGSASGKGIVKNNSDFDIPSLKFIVKYFDKNENEITTDEGYVDYNMIASGSSKSFTFYTSYIGNASSASISTKFDDDMIMKYILQKSYNGNEYSLFINSSNLK